MASGDGVDLESLLGALDEADSFLKSREEPWRAEAGGAIDLESAHPDPDPVDPAETKPSRGSLLRRRRKEERRQPSQPSQPRQAETQQGNEAETTAKKEDFLDSFLSDLIDSSDDGKPAGPEPPTPPKRRIRHKSKGPRPTCVEDGACDPSYFRSLEGFEKFWISGLAKAFAEAAKERLLRRRKSRAAACPTAAPTGDPFTRSLTTGLSSFIADARQRTRDGALEAFNGGVPADEALHEARGLVYRDMGEYQLEALEVITPIYPPNRTALVDFDAVIELEPEKGRHYYNRGVVYHRMGREEDAIEDLSRAIELGSTEAAVFSERGLAWRSFGNMAQAVIDLTSAIEADGTQTLYLSNRGQCLFEQGLYDRAEADLSRALQIDGRDAELLYRRGITRYAQKHYAESIADLKAALAQGPVAGHEAEVYYHLGVSYANLGKHVLAVPAYDQAINLTREDKPHYLHERAKSLQIVGEHKRALDDFSKVIDMQPTNARAMFRRAFSFKVGLVLQTDHRWRQKCLLSREMLMSVAAG
ncbi:unnamed protein product [Cladocopium goreaui]|uniref:Tetratricopeptide repeat protein 13 (TPR repeat protein 13) n=1 Tax=Cladocopium goreaui TaxID=2562237 RepID=A0A9P1CYF6_9DINO|nr:unnamed protein product [Cladocopium goreaui]